MTPFWLFVLPGLVVACSGAQSQPCTPVAEVEAQWQREATALIDSGMCDAYAVLDSCPRWQALNASFIVRQATEAAACSK